MSDAPPSRAGPRPRVIPSGGAHAVRVLQDIEHNAVAVGEVQSRVLARACIHKFGIAEKIAERIQMVDAHEGQRHLAVILRPGLPVRNGAHIDRGEHRFSQISPPQHGLQSADRMVVAHILIDAKPHAGALASQHHFLRFPVIRRQRFLRQNSADMRVLKRRVYNGRLRGRGHRDVENLNPVVRQKFLPRVMNLRNSSQFRCCARLARRPWQQSPQH